MSINANKSAYSCTNNDNSTLLNITILNNNNPISINLTKINETTNYKYLGLDVNLNLTSLKQSPLCPKKYKYIIHNIVSKRYLGMDLIIKFINTVAIPKISYSINFIKWSNNVLDELNDFTSSSICRTFKIPNFIPNQFWYTIKNLKSIKDTNIIKYHSTITDRTINSTIQMKSLPIYHNHITNPFLITSSLPPIQILLNNLNIKIMNPLNTPFPTPDELPHNEPSLEIFIDTSLHLKSQTGCCAIYIPKIKYTFTIFMPPQHTSNFKLYFMHSLSAGKLKQYTFLQTLWLV